MKKIWKIVMSVISFFIIVLVYSWFKTTVDHNTLLISFDLTLSRIINKFWDFISIPAIFICLVILIIVWTYRQDIKNLFKHIREIKYGDLTAWISENNPIEAEMIEKGDKTKTDAKNDQGFQTKALAKNLGNDTINVFLELDNKILSIDDVIEIMKKNKLMPVSMSDKSGMDDIYYLGVFRAVAKYLLSHYFDLKISEDQSQISFNLFPGVRELLQQTLKDTQ